jgi:hypothetical protein
MKTRYVIFLFSLRRDNRGNKRLFRWVYGVKSPAVGLRFLREKRDGGKYLYGVLSSTSTWDAIEEFGDPQIEDNYVETGTSHDKYTRVPT